MGLSPRVRGSQSLHVSLPLFGGSIPAGAGEPIRRVGHSTPARVYPRGCGGASGDMRTILAARGLSPRVRGSRAISENLGHADGSIPAGAGEPAERFARRQSGRVYPRGCGGASNESAWLPRWSGLSPRVRGSQNRVVGRRGVTGSIPAGAGEPRSMMCATNNASGLSPRVRGSQGDNHGSCADMGSIPAGAGEPTKRGRTGSASRVYPRGCGGAPSSTPRHQ